MPADFLTYGLCKWRFVISVHRCAATYGLTASQKEVRLYADDKLPKWTLTSFSSCRIRCAALLLLILVYERPSDVRRISARLCRDLIS